MSQKSKNVFARGFTLIELLVVIAIIGILAGIILVSLNGARQKANSAAIKANLAGVRNAMEVWYSTNNKYDGACADASVTAYIADNKPITGVTYNCAASGDDYSVSGGKLPGEAAPNDYWCVGSSGGNHAVSSLLGSAVADAKDCI